MSVAVETSIPRGRVSDGVTAVEESGWLILTEGAARRGDSLRDGFGLPGLWRSVPCGAEHFQRLFEIPYALLGVSGHGRFDFDPDCDPDCDAKKQLLEWGLATAGGTRPDASASDPLTPEEVEAWLPPERRRIRAGSQVAQVEIAQDVGRVALEVRALVRIPRDLSPVRQAWLASLCRDVQQRWRLVRFGLDDEGATVRAEVDLTGAPGDSARALFGLSLAALQASASWVLPGLAFATDPRTQSRLLDRIPRQDPPASLPPTRNARRTGESR